MILLGSTGSIGVNTIKISKLLNKTIEVLSAGKNIKLLNQQIALIKPKIVVVQNKKDIKKVNHNRVYYGQNGIKKAIKESKAKLVINAIVGFAGLNATLQANKQKKKIALANKESLVVAGKFIDIKNIFPIDSEHFGLWYLLNNKKTSKMIITASGGAFRDWDIKNIKHATLQDTQKHPNWNMGQKITIDSATMVNKLFEVMEAYWLYKCKNIDAIIEPSSTIHSLIEFNDGSTTAHLSNPSMTLPIAYALDKKTDKKILNNVDLLNLKNINFKPIDTKKYPIWKLKEKILQNPDLGVILNSANEVAIELFIKQKIKFFDISKIIIKAIKHFDNFIAKDIDDIFAKDKEVRKWIYKKF